MIMNSFRVHGVVLITGRAMSLLRYCVGRGYLSRPGTMYLVIPDPCLSIDLHPRLLSLWCGPYSHSIYSKFIVRHGSQASSHYGVVHTHTLYIVSSLLDVVPMPHLIVRRCSQAVSHYGVVHTHSIDSKFIIRHGSQALSHYGVSLPKLYRS